MSRAYVTATTGRQSALLPLDADNVLPPDHLSRQLLAMVDLLDMSAFEAVYRGDGRGRPPFHPRLMLTLILYCHSKGITSSRDIARACYDDVGARLITGNRYPNRSTVDRFMKAHRGAIKALLAQTLRLGHADGLVDLSIVAGDGTKVQANAAMGATIDEAALLAQIAEVQQQLAAADAAWRELVGAEGQRPPALFEGLTDPALPPPPPATDTALTKAWRKLYTLQHRMRALSSALAYLREHPNAELIEWQERLDRDLARVHRGARRLDQARADSVAKHERRRQAEAAGASVSGARPAPVEEHIRVRQARDALAGAQARAEETAANRPTTSRVNITDPHSRIMPGKRDGFDQRHNVQALACKNQFVIAITAHDSSNDKRALTDLVHEARANLDAAHITDSIKVGVFDSGYASTANFTAELPIGLILVAVDREARQTGRLNDGTSTAAQPWADMAERLKDPNNRKLYKHRGAIIEPLFAQLFSRFGRYLNHRAEDVTTELHLWAVTHNLLKIIRSRRKPRPG